MHQQAIDYLCARYQLHEIDYGGAPVSICMALPNTAPDSTAATDAWLPAGARPERGRIPSGRGNNEKQARLSCLGEAAELLGACYWGDEPMITATATALGDAAIHPNALMGFSERQYRNRESWNKRYSGDSFVPEPFDPDQVVDWVEARSLLDDRAVLVPAAYAYIGYSEASDPSVFCVGDSNGCAAGESYEAAVVNGFLELVERDATAIWWYGQHSRPAVNLDSVERTDSRNILKWYAQVERNLHVLDLTTDLGAAVFAAVSYQPDGSAVALGFGAHFDAEQALNSALTEVVQMEIPVTQARQYLDASQDCVSGILGWMKRVTLASQAQLGPGLHKSVLLLDRECGYGKSTGIDWVTQCEQVCKVNAMQLIVLDITRNEIGNRVVRDMVPGLCQSSRFRFGRLYDVPLARNRLAETKIEEDLNPQLLTV